jgi:hypothetical protein
MNMQSLSFITDFLIRGMVTSKKMNYIPMSSFTELVSGFVESGILLPIAEHIKEEYNEEASTTKIVENLMAVLHIERERYEENKGGLTIKMPSVKTTTVKRGPPKKIVPEEARCDYIRQKRPYAGIQCEKEKMKGYDFCSEHKKTANKNAAGQVKQSKIGFTKITAAVSNKMQVNADPLKDYPGCYRLLEYGYIAKRTTAGDYVCIATQDSDNKQFSSLTDENEKELKGLGFKFTKVDNIIEALKAEESLDDDENSQSQSEEE